MSENLDLFGNPIPVPRKQGRPDHEVTEEKIIFVMILLAGGATNSEVAAQLGVDVKTLRKHYSHLIRHRDAMLDRLRTKLRVTQIQQGMAGNASAINQALSMLEKVNAEGARKRVESREKPKQAKPPKLGKKEERMEAATKVATGSGKFAPPSAPKMVVNNG